MTGFEWLFWIAMGMILYAYVLFPLLLAIRAFLWPQPLKYDVRDLPFLSILVAAHNEEKYIHEKLDDVFAQRYPGEKFEVIVASDGSDDRTEEIVAGYNAGRVRLFILPRRGKNYALNAAVSASKGEVLVFSDADALMDEDALLHLATPFCDSRVGAVGGDYRYLKDGGVNQESAYWSYDRLLKWLQSRGGSMTSATGQLFAIRRSLFIPIPEKVVDDFFVSVQAPAAHLRLVFEPRAVVRGTIASTPEAEFKRKVRVLSSGFRSVWLMKRLMNPAQNGFYAIQFVTHKVLRRLVIFPMLICAGTSLLLWNSGLIYKTAAVFQILLHSAAAAGYLLRRTRFGKLKLLSLPLFLDSVNLAALVGLINALRGGGRDLWVPERRPVAVGSDLLES